MNFHHFLLKFDIKKFVNRVFGTPKPANSTSKKIEAFLGLGFLGEIFLQTEKLKY